MRTGTAWFSGRDAALYSALLSVVAVLFVASLAIGRYHVPVRETTRILASRIVPLERTWTPQMENVVMRVRLPRLAGALLVGGALALAGAAYQGVFRNPLVSPDLLGVSSGACVGASAAILMHWGALAVQVSAFAMGLVSVAVASSIPGFFRNNTTPMLVLSGVIVSGFMTSLQGLLKYFADPLDELPSIIYWAMGSLGSVKAGEIKIVGLVIAAIMGVLVMIRWRINLLALGDSEARSLGVNVKRLRSVIVLCATLMTAGAVCVSGTIGWIGLVVPHLGRIVAGHDNKRLIPVSILLGAAFTILVDTCARNLTGSEIPLSILTGVIGTPMFVWLLFAQKTTV
ncbi:MAG: iron ABC transporter permease [Synergistaceae bacterium]|jgi:iron complex transport system permease protein|nr:iron ABC transporter permease [Synergistaceae bacterium]